MPSPAWWLRRVMGRCRGPVVHELVNPLSLDTEAMPLPLTTGGVEAGSPYLTAADQSLDGVAGDAQCLGHLVDGQPLLG